MSDVAKAAVIAWTGNGCGVISDLTKKRMIEQGKYGGELATGAATAERHCQPLVHASLIPEEIQELIRFYGVTNLVELARVQARQIERLQEKMERLSAPFQKINRNPREG